jgi:hypothetical protein
MLERLPGLSRDASFDQLKLAMNVTNAAANKYKVSNFDGVGYGYLLPKNSRAEQLHFHSSHDALPLLMRSQTILFYTA